MEDLAYCSQDREEIEPLYRVCAGGFLTPDSSFHHFWDNPQGSPWVSAALVALYKGNAHPESLHKGQASNVRYVREFYSIGGTSGSVVLIAIQTVVLVLPRRLPALCGSLCFVGW